ncbi:MAG: hypothetical protein AABM67_17560 [Acidobacteriota bacterium]
MPTHSTTLKKRTAGRRPGVLILTAAIFVCVALCSAVFAQQKSVPSSKLPSAEKVVDNYLKAIGGKKRAAAIRDATYEFTTQIGDQSYGAARLKLLAPASLRFEINFANGEMISGANPRSAWVRGLDGKVRTLTGPEAAAAKLEASLNAAHLVDFKKANVLARVISLNDSPGGPAYVVEFSARSGGRLRYLFSPTTKLLIGFEDEARHTFTRFEDYRTEGGILEPHTIRMNLAGTGELKFTLMRVTYNSGLASNIFDPPRADEAMDVAALLREVSRNQDEVEKRFQEYSFLRKETNREIDGKGVVKKETVKVFEVFPLPNRRPILKLVSENDVPLSADRAAKEDKRVQEEFLKAEREKEKDAQRAAEQRAERERQKAAKKQRGEDDDPEISMFFRHCEFISPRRERFQERETIVFDFRAKPGFKPTTRQENLISKLVGVVWIDPLDKQVIRLEARLAEGFKMAGGLLVSLRPGAALVWEQTRLKEGIWMPRFAQINLSVKVLLFGGGDINQLVEWSDYKHFASNVHDYKLDAPKTAEPVKKP